MKLLIVDDQSTVVQGLLHCTNWAAMGFTVVYCGGYGSERCGCQGQPAAAGGRGHALRY